MSVELINPDMGKLTTARFMRDRFQLNFECWVIDDVTILGMEGDWIRVHATLVKVECNGDETNWIQS